MALAETWAVPTENLTTLTWLFLECKDTILKLATNNEGVRFNCELIDNILEVATVVMFVTMHKTVVIGIQL